MVEVSKEALSGDRNFRFARPRRASRRERSAPSRPPGSPRAARDLDGFPDGRRRWDLAPQLRLCAAPPRSRGRYGSLCFAGKKMAFVKSGWLLRQTNLFHFFSGTILKRWKKNWFDLWSDGHLIYYDDQSRQSIEDKVHMPVDCINIRTGRECRDIQPPDGKQKDCMLQIVCRDGKTISLCAESTDDCLAWKFTLQDSRTNTAYVGSEVMYDETVVASSPPPYTAYATPTPEVGSKYLCYRIQAYGYGPYSGAYPPGTQVVYAANGQAYGVPYQYPYTGLYGQQPANQVIIRERYRDSDSDLALGMLAGAATGMALGSLFWVF
ncbi:Pleckstrin homology domain-containing family B member 2 [Galemys pyrenaicus]|uniref:Pleckstrin homology domain-containing family B member 2 n=1 Tax=Galemys pyrenaicus TaxID=202257 RepID=A0A8J6AKG8_GALPY|nr:Pleckstrin homology domain-containing family B member 2 [Galemys pyrenaicus]